MTATIARVEVFEYSHEVENLGAERKHVRVHRPGARSVIGDFVVRITDFVRADPEYDPEYDPRITGTMKTAHLTEAFGLDCEIHLSGLTPRVRMSAIRNSNYYELAFVGPTIPTILPPIYADDHSDAMTAVGAGGCYPVPPGPGLGVALDGAFIGRRRTDCHVFGP